MANSIRNGISLSRRALLQGCGAVSLAGAMGALSGSAVLASEKTVHALKLGAFDVMVVSDGTLGTGSIGRFGRGRPLEEVVKLFKDNGLDETTTTPELNLTLVKTETDLILIDTGGGMNFQSTAGKLVDNLEAADIDPEKITKVILTHAHPDHVWGIIDDFEEAERFANATYYIAATEWDFWMQKDVASKIPEPLRRIVPGTLRNLKPVADKVKRIKAGEDIAPGIGTIATPGHTPGHMSVHLKSKGESLIVTGDAITHPLVSFARPDWHFLMDADGAMAAKSRKKLLDIAVAEKAMLIGYHLPWPGVGRVERKDNAFRFIVG